MLRNPDLRFRPGGLPTIRFLHPDLLIPTLEDLRLFLFTVGVSGLAILLVAPFAVGFGYWSARRQGVLATLFDAVAALPLAMPPVAVGILLLNLLAQRAPLGSVLSQLGLVIPFTWKAVVVALSVMSFPLVFRPVRASFQEIPVRYEELSRTLGRSELATFLRVSLPLARQGILGGLLLGWARALGEFGCTIILAGNIAGRTRTLSLAIFHRFQMGEDLAAVRLAVLTGLLTLLLVAVSNLLVEENVS